MATAHKVGSKVSWHWGKGTAHGKVIEKFEKRVQRTIKGSKVVKVGTSDDPAYLIEQDDGDRVLKHGTELGG